MRFECIGAKLSWNWSGMLKKIYEDAGLGDASVREAGYSLVRPCLGETASPRNTIAA